MKQATRDENKVEAASRWGTLDTFATLWIDGRDALAFTQAQLANDVRTLADRCWQWNCLLNAQGRVLALLLLARIDAEHFCAILPQDAAEFVRAHLARYVLRSRVALSVDAAVPMGRTGGAVGRIAAGGRLQQDGDGWCLAIAGRYGRQFAIGQSAEGRLEAPIWRLADIDDGIPWLSGEAIAFHVPHALGLAALPAFSTNKGCYPGQEIVARTHFLGRNKRRLVRWSAIEGPLPLPGTRLLCDDPAVADAVGHVVLAAERTDGSRAGLAVLRDDAPPRVHLDVDGAPCAIDADPATDAHSGAS